MGPTKPTSEAEFKVIRWLFVPAFVVAMLYLGWGWFTQVRACTATCHAQGFRDGHVHLNGGTKLDAGSHCECVEKQN